MVIHGIGMKDGKMVYDDALLDEAGMYYIVIDTLAKIYKQATVVYAFIDRASINFFDIEKTERANTAFMHVKEALKEFVEGHWGKETEVVMSTAYSPLGVKILAIVFGVPSLIRREELEKIASELGIDLNRHMRKRVGELEESVVKLLLSKWIAEGLEAQSCTEVLQQFRERGITRLELYSIKDRKWAGRKPKHAIDDDAISHLSAWSVTPI